MEKTTNVFIGSEAETLAADYLMKKGYRLLERNFRYGKKEIDLIMKDGQYIVFVEVKARSSVRYGTPAEFVDFKKQQRLISAATYFLVKNGLTETRARFDIVEIYLSSGEITHIQNAFQLN